MSKQELIEESSRLLTLRNTIKEKEDLLEKVKGEYEIEKGEEVNYSEAEELRSKKAERDRKVKKIQSKIDNLRQQEKKQQKIVIDLIPTSDQIIKLPHKFEDRKRTFLVKYDTKNGKIDVEVE